MGRNVCHSNYIPVLKYVTGMTAQCPYRLDVDSNNQLTTEKNTMPSLIPLISFVFKFTALCIILPHCVQSYCTGALKGGGEMGPETSHVHKITYGPLIDTALYVMCLMGGKSITQAIGFAPIKHITYGAV